MENQQSILYDSVIMSLLQKVIQEILTVDYNSILI
jgi:hypothetical protein